MHIQNLEEIQGLISKFDDVFVQNIPKGLLPQKEVQHAMDLVMGSIIPNRLEYSMNLREHEEL